MKILKGCILITAALIVSTIALVSCLHGGKMTTITVTPPNQYMARGSTQQFTAIATLSDGQTVNWTTAATWASLNSTVVATISNTVPTNGLATAGTTVGTTTTTITATDPINGIASSPVTVTVKDPDSIIVHPSKPYMCVGVGVGTVHQFTAMALFSGGTYTQDLTQSPPPSFKWDTSDNTLATMSTTTGSFGLLTIVTAGTSSTTFNITIADSVVSGGTITGTAVLTWTSNQLLSIAVSPNPTPPTITTIGIGGTRPYTAQGTYPAGTIPAETIPDFKNSVTWSSTNPAVATIDPDSGLATGVAAGTIYIVATDPITGIAGSTLLKVQ